MKRFFKVLSLGIVVVIVAGMHTGCSEKQKLPEETAMNSQVEITKPQSEQAQEKTKLRIMSQFGGTDQKSATYKERLEEFKKENPDIIVEDESDIVNDYWKARVITDFLANNEPDIIFTFIGSDSKVVIDEQKVVSIEEIRKEYPNYAGNISKEALESVKELDGNIYAVPILGFYEGLFVNKKIFNQYGLELPEDWEKLEVAINTLKEKGKIPIAVALGHAPDYWIDNLILSQGGSDIHKNQNISAVKNEWALALEHFKTLYNMGAFPKDTNSNTNDNAIGLFENEEAAMLLDKDTIGEEFSNSQDIVLLPFPAVPGGKKKPTNIIGGFCSGWYITKKAWDDPLKRNIVVKFVEKMTETDAITEFAISGGIPSTNIDEESPLLSLEIIKNRPIESWLAKPAWDKLVSKIPSIATGKEDPMSVINEIIIFNK